jgi:putative membrane protein
MNRFSFWKHLNWRILLLRIVVNGLALLVTALLVPTIFFVDRRLWVWLVLAVAMGVLNAVIKPIIQFLTLRFIFATYGLVVVIINAILLGLLASIFPSLFAVESVLWALVGGAVFGIFAAVFENLLGLAPPIVSEQSPEIRRQIRANQRSMLAEYLDYKEAQEEAAEGQQAQEASPHRSEAAAILAVVGGGQPQPAPATDLPQPLPPATSDVAAEALPTTQAEPAPTPASADSVVAELADDAISRRQEA